MRGATEERGERERGKGGGAKQELVLSLWEDGVLRVCVRVCVCAERGANASM